MVIEKIRETIEKNGLIEKGDSILVALSGGPDSVCLIHALSCLREEYDLSLYAFHLNHRIRGIAAHKDALYSMKIANQLEIPCFTLSLDIPALSQKAKTTLEEEARNQRYEALSNIKKKLGINKIAVAHNLDDQAETVMMRLLRGTGLNGLKGMEYKRKDDIIRPLLDVDKESIIQYCEEQKLNPCIDNTNFEDEYTRNKIRLKLIPFIEKEFSPKFKENLCKMSRNLKEDNTYIESVAEKEFNRTAVGVDGYSIKMDIDTNGIFENRAILKRIILKTIEKLIGDINGIEAIHLNDIIDLAQKGKDGGRINISRGIIVYKKVDSLIFTTKELKKELKNFNYEIKYDNITSVNEIGKYIDAKVMTKEKSMQLPIGVYTKAFDIDKIKGKLRVRNREIGDKIKPLGLGGTKKVKDIFIDAKVPLDKRESIPLIVDDEKVIWIVGHKISEECKIDDSTKNVVRLSIKDI